MIKSLKRIHSFFNIFIITLLACVSCIGENMDDKNKAANSETYLKLKISVPEYKNPEVAASLKSMSQAQEKAIIAKDLSILVFKNNKFYYKAPIVSITPDPQDQSVLDATIKLVRSKQNDKFNLVIIANKEIPIDLKEDQVLKEDIIESLQYSMPSDNKWKTGANNNFTPFPMWAELKDVEVSENMQPLEVHLYRALARIDVGLNFQMNGDAATETAAGFSKFIIADIRVYRTYTKGYAAPKYVDFTTTPSIPAEAKRLTESEPIIYTPTSQETSNAYVREIYVPEANIPENMEEVHCVLVGGYYANSTTISYFRMDFAKDELSSSGNESRSYYPILRNHRYVFNIHCVNGPGAATPEEALKIINSGSIEYGLVVWDENIDEMHMQGKYYFGMNSRDQILGFKSSQNDPANYKDIEIQTNYPLTESDPLKLSWHDNGILFKAVMNSDRTIRVTPNLDNETDSDRSTFLSVTCGGITITSKIIQEHMQLNYSLICESVEVVGNYIKGQALNGSTHLIKLNIWVDDPQLHGAKVQLRTDQTNGISFTGEGIIDFSQTPSGQPLIMPVTLKGSGTLTAGQPFDVIINSNSKNGAFCQTEIPAKSGEIEKFTIVTMGPLENTMGWDFGQPNSGAHQLFLKNFVEKDNGPIKIRNTQFIRGGMLLKDNDAEKYITGNGAKLADLLVMSRNNMDEGVAKIVKTYMQKGGVVLYFSEYPSAKFFMNEMFGLKTDIKQGFLDVKITPNIGNNIYWGTDTEGQKRMMESLKNDPIMVGHYGDVRDKFRALDGFDQTFLGYLFPEDAGKIEQNKNITIYSYFADHNNIKQKRITSFKYESEDINFVWIGDGGIIASGVNGARDDSGDKSPLYWNLVTFMPEPRPRYKDKDIETYNSIEFMNMMVWAVKKSEELKGKRGK